MALLDFFRSSDKYIRALDSGKKLGSVDCYVINCIFTIKNMIQTTHVCGKCESSNIVKNGHNQSGTAQYLYKNCGTCRVLNSKQRTKQIDMDALSRTYEERNSYRSVGRIFGISHVTVYNLLKKSKITT